MATVQERNEAFRILFCYQGKRHTVGLGKVGRKEADAKADQIDYLLLRIKQGLLTVPKGVPIDEFMLADGQVKAVEEVRDPEPVTFGKLRDEYLETLQNGSVEDNTLETIRMHLRHFGRSFGERF